MKMPSVSLLAWQKRYSTEQACAKALAKVRWPDGFRCPRCSGTKAYYVKSRKVYQCSQCRHQASITADTLFHSTNLPLVKWFWAIYLIASDKGGISALRLAKHIGVSQSPSHGIWLFNQISDRHFPAFSKNFYLVKTAHSVTC